MARILLINIKKLLFLPKITMKDVSVNVIKRYRGYTNTPGEIAKSAFYYVQDVGYYCCGSGHVTIRTGMKSILFLISLSGRGYLHYRGKKYMVKAGDTFFINCIEHHRYGTEGDKDWEFKFIHFFGNNSSDIYEIIYEIYGPVLLDEARTSVLENILDDIIIEAGERSIHFEPRIMSLIANLLSEIIQLSATRLGEVKNNKPNKMVERAIDYISKNYSTGILLDDIARAAYASKYHFSRVFKRITGSSPYFFLMNYRINISKEKLKFTSKNITEIAVESGFDSPSNFIKTFRSIEGVTPHNYRRIWMG
jgi:AraC-like DNA-binding protein